MGSYDLSFFRGYLWKNISWASIWDKDNVQPEDCSSKFVYNVRLRPKFKVTYFRFLNYFPFTFRSWSSTKVFEIKGLETRLFSLEIAVLTFHYIRGLSLHNVKGMKKKLNIIARHIWRPLSCHVETQPKEFRLGYLYTVKNIPRLCLSVFDFQTLEKSQESQWSHSVLFNLDINFELQA